jgi:hypothetical protein
MRSDKWFIQGVAFTLAWLCLTTLPVAGQTDEAHPPGDGYHPGNYGRVRYKENGLTIARAETGSRREFLAAGHVNTPIFAGDTLATGPKERAEAQLANAALVRLDQHTHVVFSALPDPYPETQDKTVLRLTQGGVRIESSLDDQKEFLLETPGCRIYLAADSDLRVYVRGGRTRVSTLRGMARVESGGSSLVLRAGMGTEVIGGAAPLGPRPYNSFLAEGFDHWVAARKSHSAANLGLTPSATTIQEALPAQVQPFFRELSLHGIWVRNDHFGYAWVPQVSEANWRPYRAGHWGHGQLGYFWISHEPWGWAPYHYGRWIWLDALGWAWVPGTVFGGAWVAWAWGPAHAGWAALDFWNAPARRSAVGEGVIDPLSWTVVSYEDVGQPDLVQHQIQSIGDGVIQFLAIVQTTPTISPNRLAQPEDRRQAIAEAQEQNAILLAMAATDEGATTNRRSFLELERRGDQTTGEAGQISAAARISSPDPDDLRKAEFQPTMTTAPTAAKLQASGSDNIVRGQPTASRPLVHFEQKGAVAITERWRVIYRTIARPRPTQSAAGPPAGSPAANKVEAKSTPPEK